VNPLSAGRLRRLAQPILFRYWFRRSANRAVSTSVAGFKLRVLPTVFHPKYFGSSLILGRYVESQAVRGRSFLDMGTGSGIVGLCAARAGAMVTGVDVNPAAVECANRNATHAGLEIEYLRSDLYSALSGRQFDFIVWNPPFFPKPCHNVAEAALHAGPRYDVIARFARDSRAHMPPGGRILLILSLDIDVEAVERLFRTEGFEVRRTSASRWGFGETMVILEIQ
jgi:release factor glutamine methyltransferase